MKLNLSKTPLVPGQLISKQWMSSESNWKKQKTYREKYKWDGRNLPRWFNPPNCPGFGVTKISVRFDHEEQTAIYEWVFETVANQPVYSGFGKSTSTTVKTLQASLSKSPITMHRDIGKWLAYKNPITGKKFGRLVGGEVKWELEDPRGGAGGRKGLDPSGNLVTNVNPLYGVSDFYEVGAVWAVEKMITKGNMKSLLRGVGKIRQPEGLPDNPDPRKRNWLYAGAQLRQMGNRFLAKQSWLLSGYGGWERALYDENYFNKQ